MGGTEVAFGGDGAGILVGRAASLPGFGTIFWQAGSLPHEW